MVTQSAIGLNSRSEADPFDENGFLPLITAPMYSVVNESNYQIFLDNKIQVCLPRNITFSNMRKFNGFVSYSLEDFKKYFIDLTGQDYLPKVCIDTANGNMEILHDIIKKAKEIHGDKLVIMAGNVASVEAFVELAKTGVDYIRVGIGGGLSCNTTSNTGVGQEDLEYLIRECYQYKKNYPSFLRGHEIIDKTQVQNIQNVKIVADGISSYIKLCQDKYGFNDNGYAAINKLLFAGADLVMIGKLFAQCIESAGEKSLQGLQGVQLSKYESLSDLFKKTRNKLEMVVKYSGMSTQTEQVKYKPLTNLGAKDLSVPELKPSEGSVQWIPVRFLLRDWIKGNSEQDNYPFLMGFENALRSAMSYTGAKTLQEFKK